MHVRVSLYVQARLDWIQVQLDSPPHHSNPQSHGRAGRGQGRSAQSEIPTRSIQHLISGTSARQPHVRPKKGGRIDSLTVVHLTDDNVRQVRPSPSL